jgi:hypothetical protein
MGTDHRVWFDEFADIIGKDRVHRVFYGGLWPVYSVRVIFPLRFDAIMNPVNDNTKYFFGKRRMIAYLTKIKLKYPEASFEKY